MTTRIIRRTLLAVLMAIVWILAINQTEATSPINISFNQTSKTIRVPEDYPTIQMAVDSANPGDTIFVYNGTYKEHIIVNKTLTLTGQNKTTTIIDGNGTGTPLTIIAPNVTVTEFTIRSGPTKPPSFPLSAININSSSNTIQNNTITENDFCAVELTHHGNNTIKQNTITNNTIGILLLHSNNNTIIQNNLINNLDNAEIYSSHNNTWDSGYPHGGNHWSDYTGVDEKSGPNQDETGSDTIGDTSYKIDENNQDNYPLINPWTSEPTKTFTIKCENETYHVNTKSNSTITHFQFDQTQKQISFNVTGSPDTTNYCNMTIPKSLLRNNPWTIMIDNKTICFAETKNETHTFLHFTYQLQTTHHIIIRGTWVIPEFPSNIIPLLSIITLLTAILTKRKKPKTKTRQAITTQHQKLQFTSQEQKVLPSKLSSTQLTA